MELGIRSDWEGELGSLDEDDVQAYVPFAIQRLYRSSSTHDTSRIGLGGDTDVLSSAVKDEADPNEQTPIEQATWDGVRVVRKLSLEYFKSKLVEHFDIMFTHRRLVWPSRLLPRRERASY